MHYFLYPFKDTYISNHPNQKLKNYGLDENIDILSTKNTFLVYTSSSLDTVVNTSSYHVIVQNFTGYITGSVESGSGYINPTGSVIGSNNEF